MRFACSLLLLLGLAACNGEIKSPNDTAPPPSVERQIAPDATDPAIDLSLEPHIAINPDPSAPAAGKLFVFLPGTGAVPTQYRMILRTGAGRGYHAIGLSYPNPEAVGVLCEGSPEADCHWDVRREIITGSDTSPLVTVNAANSIVNRLQKLLSYLDAQHPDEGWGQYLSDGAVDWSRIVVAGHSQGGGHAAVMAKLFGLSRAVYFSSPADWNAPSGAPVPWTSRPSATDPSRQYGFTHLRDAIVPVVHVLPTWQALGLHAYGQPASIDAASPPYAGSHQLTTNATPNPVGGGILSYHAATVADAVTPLLTPGVPLFEPAWIYLCFP